MSCFVTFFMIAYFSSLNGMSFFVFCNLCSSSQHRTCRSFWLHRSLRTRLKILYLSLFIFLLRKKLHWKYINSGINMDTLVSFVDPSSSIGLKIRHCHGPSSPYQVFLPVEQPLEGHFTLIFYTKYY